jgi:cell division protein ZapB
MTEQELEQLELKIKTLLHHMNVLKDENRSLHESQSALMAERSRLIEKNESAKNRVEAIITRLKAMEIEI